jgi:Cd2+/Zn2+-exporting ATPase
MTARATITACPACELHAESVFKIEGMDCHEEVAVLERRLKRLPGLERLSADVMGQRLRVAYDGARLDTSAIVEAVGETGMRAWLEHEEPTARLTGSTRGRFYLVVASGATLVAGVALDAVSVSAWLVVPLFLASAITGGIHTARRALAAARGRSLDINVLMLIAVVGALALNQWAEAATVIFLFALAQFLETRSMERARHAVRSLMDLAPGAASIRDASGERRVKVDDVPLGATIVIRPGEKIPLDGVITAGESEVNQAPITGESIPVARRPGDEVLAGTINGRGALDVRVTKLRRDTTMARIINLVEVAQSRRAPSQAFVERFAKYYTPAVITLAVVLAVVPPLILGQAFNTWFYRALVLLVISCPCALVISTPVSIVSALAGAARKGVLIKGGVHLERTGAVRCVAFDKTGTLTRGRPEVVEVIPLNGAGPRQILQLAATLEARSEHPIGGAILRAAAAEGIAAQAPEAFQALPGRGAEARVNGCTALVGNHRLFEERGLCSPAIDDQLERLAADGRTAVLVAQQQQPIGIIGVADALRESGRDAVALLKRQGVEHVVMLTGDNAVTAASLARALALDEFHAELLPEDKVAAVVRLRRKYGAVAMVGDGVNDAPAMAAADVGIAMGVAGTDAALETADVALMADDLLKIPYTIRLSRRTVRNIKTNIALSLGLKAVFLALGVAGLATLWMAVVADMGASILVIANGLRLLRAE